MQQEILEIVRSHPRITGPEIASKLNLFAAEAIEDLRALEADGKIQSERQKDGTGFLKWTVV